jgi:predicted GTPase/gas vesicle protein
MLSSKQASFSETNSALTEAVGISDNLEFIKRLSLRLELKPKQKRQIALDLQAIQHRQADTNLYLGVIGEFSSGKTSLINALMREDLLKTDVLQATTAAATWMRYGDELDIIIDFVGGEKRSYREDGIALWQRFANWIKTPSGKTENERIRTFIHKITAKEEIAAQISKVTILHPADAFQKGLIIIDTPGANAENQRHVEVAGATLRKHCNAAIVTIPADIPLSQTLVKFLRDHASEILHRCVFVVTKMDTIRCLKERERLIEVIKARIKKELCISQVQLFAVAPRIVVEDAMKIEHIISLDQVEQFIDGFSEFERLVWGRMDATRTIVILERLARLLKSPMEWLQLELKKYEKIYAERHAALLKARIPDLGNFITKQKRYHRNELKTKLRNIPTEASRLIRDKRDFVMTTIQDEIFETIEATELKTYVNEDIQVFVEKQNKKLQIGFVKLDRKIRKQTEVQLNKFEVEFKKIYRMLKSLDGKLSINEGLVTIREEVRGLMTESDSFIRVTNLLDESETAENWAIGGGAGAGAVLGTFLFPGVGTIIGAALGSFIGGLFGPDIDELQEKSWHEVKDVITHSYDQAKISIMDSVRVAMNGANDRLTNTLDVYFDEYESLVKKMIERDREEQKDLEKRRSEVEQSINEAHTRLQRIKKISQKLETVQFDM